MTVHLHRAHGADLDYLLRLRNDPSVLKHGEAGRLADRSWFDGAAVDAIYAPVGYVRIQDAVVSIALEESMRGRGLGVAALVAARQYYPHLALVAHIHPDNHASIRAFTKAGFTIDQRPDQGLLRASVS